MVPALGLHGRVVYRRIVHFQVLIDFAVCTIRQIWCYRQELEIWVTAICALTLASRTRFRGLHNGPLVPQERLFKADISTERQVESEGCFGLSEMNLHSTLVTKCPLFCCGDYNIHRWRLLRVISACCCSEMPQRG